MKKRIFLFDNLKFLLMTTVVIGHLSDCLVKSSDIMKSTYIFIYAFHMPLFIYLSGLFHSNRNVKNRCISFIFMGFSMKVLLYLSKLIFFHKTDFLLLSDDGIPWFMFALAMFTACSYFLRDIDLKIIFLLSIILACIVGYDKSIGDYLYLSRFVVFYPFYLLGQMSDKNRVQELNHSKILKVFSLGGIAIWGYLSIRKLDLIYILRPLFTGRNSFDINPSFEVYGPLYRILCILITLLTCICLLSLVPNKRIPFISSAGQRTLQVYFWHYPAIHLMQYFKVDDILVNTAWGQALWVSLGIFLTIIFSTKFFAFPVVHIQKAFSHIPSRNE